MKSPVMTPSRREFLRKMMLTALNNPGCRWLVLAETFYHLPFAGDVTPPSLAAIGVKLCKGKYTYIGEFDRDYRLLHNSIWGISDTAAALPFLDAATTLLTAGRYETNMRKQFGLSALRKMVDDFPASSYKGIHEPDQSTIAKLKIVLKKPAPTRKSRPAQRASQKTRPTQKLPSPVVTPLHTQKKTSLQPQIIQLNHKKSTHYSPIKNTTTSPSNKTTHKSSCRLNDHKHLQLATNRHSSLKKRSDVKKAMKFSWQNSRHVKPNALGANGNSQTGVLTEKFSCTFNEEKYTQPFMFPSDNFVTFEERHPVNASKQQQRDPWSDVFTEQENHFKKGISPNRTISHAVNHSALYQHYEHMTIDTHALPYKNSGIEIFEGNVVDPAMPNLHSDIPGFETHNTNKSTNTSMYNNLIEFENNCGGGLRSDCTFKDIFGASDSEAES